VHLRWWSFVSRLSTPLFWIDFQVQAQSWTCRISKFMFGLELGKAIGKEVRTKAPPIQAHVMVQILLPWPHQTCNLENTSGARLSRLQRKHIANSCWPRIWTSTNMSQSWEYIEKQSEANIPHMQWNIGLSFALIQQDLCIRYMVLLGAPLTQKVCLLH
jgi:hypothetical protein